jgi:co-chaperonin GroES (HSP10)
LVEPAELEKHQGLIQIPDNVRANSASVEQSCRVVAVGPEAWKDETVPRARSGDLVLVTKYAGYLTMGPADGKLYRLVNANDIFCRVQR